VSAQLERWPVARPAVAGDEIALVITLTTPDDLTGTEWDAIIREYPGGPEVARWECTLDVATTTLTLRLSPDESAKIAPGYGFDVRQTAPIAFTWLSVETLNVVASYSYEPPPEPPVRRPVVVSAGSWP
jgi:hypothetical protein